jgi:CheY-like chemotaxis protein
MYGIAACAQIKKASDIPVLFVSAYTDPEIMARAFQHNPSGYLTRPFTNHELLQTVEKILAGN